MPINITMPALSPTMEEGNLAKWLVKEGDKVAPGDVIAEIETDKATMEVEAVDEGTVAKLVVPAGTEAVKVNALIAILAADGEDVAEAAKGGDAAPAKAEAKTEAPKQDAVKAEAPKEEAVPAKAEKPVADQPAASSTPAPVAKSGERIFASPLARRLAKEAGLDLSAVSAWPYRQDRRRKSCGFRRCKGCSRRCCIRRHTGSGSRQGPVGRSRSQAVRRRLLRARAA